MSDDGTVVPNGPQWIARRYAPKTGRDHLGLNEVNSGEILAALSPSVNVLTIHPRYHSFYCFVLKRYWQTHGKVSHKTWKQFFRRLDFIFSVACNLCDHDEHGDMSGVVGSSVTAGLARSGGDGFQQDYHYIDSPFGGYSLYYRTVMIEMGLLVPGGPGLPYPVDALTPELGILLAEAFESVVADTEYVREYLDYADRLVPLEVAREYGRTACFCRLYCGEPPDAPLLRDIFLSKGREPEARAATLRMFVDLAAQTEGHGLSQAAFRRLIFYGRSRDGMRYAPTIQCALKAREWRGYQAHEYYTFALNLLWRHFCEWGVSSGGTVHPIPLEEFRQYLASACDFAELGNALGIEQRAPLQGCSLRELMEWIAGANGTGCEEFDLFSELDSPFSEDRLTDWDQMPSPSHVAEVQGMLAILAMTLLRFGDASHQWDKDWWVFQRGGAERPSIDYFCRTARDECWLDLPVESFAFRVYERFIVQQHIAIAAGKLPENTFRFNYAHDGLLFTDLSNPVAFNDSRFGAITTTVRELGLCGDLRHGEHGPTEVGRRFLATGAI